MADRWHILRDHDGLTLARTCPPRFDIWADTVLPLADPLRLAHQIRQDMWRALQKVRGFSPVVRITADTAQVHIRAGGRIDGVVPARASGRIADVLENPVNRDRWIRHATRRSSFA